MKKILDWIVSHTKTITILTLIIMVITPAIVWLSYFIGKDGKGIYTEISADGILAYIAPVITSIATLFIGIIALALSDKANEISLKLTQLEMNRYKFELRPFVMVTGWKAYNKFLSEIIDPPVNLPEIYSVHIDDTREQNLLCISVSLTNTTESYVSVQFKGACEHRDNGDREWLKNVINPRFNKLRLQQNSSSDIVLCASRNFLQEAVSNKITIKLILENRFGKRYEESFDFIITYLLAGGGGWSISAVAQNYEIGRFETNRDGQIVLIPEDL